MSQVVVREKKVENESGGGVGWGGSVRDQTPKMPCFLSFLGLPITTSTLYLS